MENLSFFDGQQTMENLDGVKDSSHLDVVKLHYDSCESLTWQELFSGFDQLYAITYSSGLGFVCKLLDHFEQAEIIFGCEDVLDYSMQSIMAYQCRLIERMRNEPYRKLSSRVENGTLHLYVARDVLSHEKIYLLSAKNGRKRVVMGSANMSASAFEGRQRENICYMDGDEAFDWYMECYQTLKEKSTDEIEKSALLCADDGEHLEELPIAKTVRVKKALVIQTVSEEQKEEVRFALDVKGLAAKFKPCVPKPDKKGKLMLSPDKVRIIRKRMVESKTLEKEQRSEYPQLDVEPDEGCVTLNDQRLDLTPPKAEIEKDVELFLRYMDGYKKFHGDHAGMQLRYYEFANWFFCSPFMACMRDMAVRYNQNTLPYPVFGLVYGQSKAGKTSFLETLLKMMIGQKTKISAPDFTRSSIDSLKQTVHGAPIIVDDLTNTRFNQHAIETIKNDDFGIAEHLTNYPAVVISANEDVKAVAPEVIRRTVICRVQAGLTNTEVMSSNIVRTVQREIGTAFYREYLRRMLEIVPELLELMKNDEQDSAPDILKASSQILMDIFKEYGPAELPKYIRTLSLEDYFSEKVTGSYAIKTIRDAWKTSRNSFEIYPRTNELCYNAGATYEADRILKELPETLEVRKSRDCLMMNLEEAQNFFGISFKKPLIPWLSKFFS